MVVSSLPNLAASCSPTAATKAPVVMLSPMVRASVRQFLKLWGVIVDLLFVVVDITAYTHETYAHAL
jgi:hypothetical protein